MATHCVGVVQSQPARFVCISFPDMYCLFVFMPFLCTSRHETITAILQVGAPFGSCKNISVPSTSPLTSTAGSFTGSVQFSKSTSYVHRPSCLLFVIFYFLKVLLLL